MVGCPIRSNNKVPFKGVVSGSIIGSPLKTAQYPLQKHQLALVKHGSSQNKGALS